MALVNFAKFCGIEYQGTDDDNNMLVKYRDTVKKFKVLEILEFDSDRKKQSIILKDEEGQIVLYCKGADSSLNNRFSHVGVAL